MTDPGPRYWLLKTEPNKYSLDDLQNDVDQSTHWDGVRNYQARNSMRDDMQVGDLCLWYHSSIDIPQIVGLARIVQTGFVDPSQFDPQSDYFDPQSTLDNPRWICMRVCFHEHFSQPVTLNQLKEFQDGPLAGLGVIKRGNRLSVQPVSKEHFEFICQLGRR